MVHDLQPDIDSSLHNDTLLSEKKPCWVELDGTPFVGDHLQVVMAQAGGGKLALEVRRRMDAVRVVTGQTVAADTFEISTKEDADAREHRSDDRGDRTKGHEDRIGDSGQGRQTEPEPDEASPADNAGGNHNDGRDGGDIADDGESNGENGDWKNRIVTVRESIYLPDVPWISLGADASPEDADIAVQVAEVRAYQRKAREAVTATVGVGYPIPTQALATRYTALGLSFSPSICIVPNKETVAKISEFDGGAIKRPGSDYGTNDTHGAYSTALDTGFVFVNNVTTPRVAAVTAAHEGGGHASEEQVIIFTTRPDGTRGFVAMPAVEQSTAMQELRHEWIAGLMAHDIYGKAGTLSGTYLDDHEVPARLALRGQTTDLSFTWGQMAIDATIFRGGDVDEGLLKAYLEASKSADHLSALYERLERLAPRYVMALEQDMYADPREVALAARDLCLRFTDRNDPQAAVRAATAVEQLFRRAVHS